jgi:hypothetical protein
VTVIVDKLVANQWQSFSALKEDNATTRGASLMGWIGNHSGIDYIAKWNQTAQAFLVHQKNTNPYNTTSIDFGTALFVYPTSNTIMIRSNWTSTPKIYENNTLSNASASGVWKFVGSPYIDRTLSDYSKATLSNTSWAFFYNNTYSMYTGYARNFGPSQNNIYVRKGLCVWIDVNTTADMTYSSRVNLGW